MPQSRNTLNVRTSAELLSYIINYTPELRGEIELPVQGQSIAPIGKIIVNNERYKNAFLNTVNLIGLTVIDRNNDWDNPWDSFTDKGSLRWGQQIREVINDLCNVYDYNENFADKERFLRTIVPNVVEYMHEVNFQKFYQTTTSDAQMAMAFENDDLFSFIDDMISMLYESLKYDRYVVNKYMLCRRIVDGTITAKQIADFSTKTNRQIVSEIKAESNKMTFRSPNYNPAGIRRYTKFSDQIAIVNTDFDAKFTTDVLATSYFKSDAEMKAGMALIDSFSNHDTDRLLDLFAKRDANGDIIPNTYINGYVPFTDAELTALAEIPCCIISRDFFMNYRYAMDNSSGEKRTEWYNPTTLERNHFLHYWGVFSTSPFSQALCFTQTAQNVTAVAISPDSLSLVPLATPQVIGLSAAVTATGFANKAVTWKVDSTAATAGVTINEKGVMVVPANTTLTGITVTATSVYKSSVYDTLSVTITQPNAQASVDPNNRSVKVEEPVEEPVENDTKSTKKK